MKEGSSKGRRKTEEEKREDEVEKMLQAAQDQILLNLSLNSHITRPSLSQPQPPPPCKDDLDLDLDLDFDLQRRFQALKTKVKPQTQDPQLGTHLSARFAALKSKSSPSTTLSASNSYHQDEESEDDEDTQVQKLMDWAKDAAHLDPSPPSDSDDEPHT